MRLLRTITRLPQGIIRRIHDYVDPVGHARGLGVRVGEGCRLIQVNFGTEPYLITLGDRVSATRTSFITHDGSAWVFRAQYPDADLIAPIIVGNNVFLGIDTVVLPGVTIGDNVVVGASAVVVRDLPADCVAMGIPARPLKTLDEYWRSVEHRVLPTFTMSRNRKREYLMKHFGISPS